MPVGTLYEWIDHETRNGAGNLRPSFERKQFTLRTGLKAQRCLCDPLRINQCLTVLFDNALHYSTSRKLIVKKWRVWQRKYILIQDEGLGIPREFHDFLFQPFPWDKGARQLNPEERVWFRAVGGQKPSLCLLARVAMSPYLIDRNKTTPSSNKHGRTRRTLV